MDFKALMITKKYVNCYIERQNGDILLLERALHHKIGPGKVAGVGGKVEPGESVHDAVIREVKEEAGITGLSQIRLRCILRWQNVDDHDMLAFVFTAHTASEPVSYAPGEGRLFWCRKGDIVKHNVFPDIPLYIVKMWKSQSMLFGRFAYDGCDKISECNVGSVENILGYAEPLAYF